MCSVMGKCGEQFSIPTNVGARLTIVSAETDFCYCVHSFIHSFSASLYYFRVINSLFRLKMIFWLYMTRSPANIDPHPFQSRVSKGWALQVVFQRVGHHIGVMVLYCWKQRVQLHPCRYFRNSQISMRFLHFFMFWAHWDSDINC